MAGAGYKLFNTGDVLTAAQVNTYLQEQVVMVFANAAARTTALSGVLAEGMVTYLKDTDALEIYSGTAWVGYGSGDITGITTGATSGLTGGVTSGTADLKLNTTAKGGLLVGTGSGTVTELAVGSNNTVLTADSSTASGLKWAAAAGGSNYSGCQVFNSAALACTSGAYTTLTFNSETYDVDGYHSTSSNTERLTVPTGKAGYFWIYAWGDFENNDAMEWVMKIRDNGGNELARSNQYKSGVPRPHSLIYTVRYLADAAWVDLQIYQATGSTKNYEISGTYGAFGMYRIGG